MSSLQYTTYPGMGETLSNQNHYSQTVRLPTNPPTIKISGQGGWDPVAQKIAPPTTPDLLRQQIDQAFSNVELALKNAGSRGWSDVYLVRAFYVVDGEAGTGETWKEQMEWAVGTAAEGMRKWCGPEHRPVLTAVEVKGLAAEGMKIEIEVEALLQE